MFHYKMSGFLGPSPKFETHRHADVLFWHPKFLSPSSDIPITTNPSFSKVDSFVRWFLGGVLLGIESSRWFKVTFSSPSWRSLNLWKGHLTIPKRSLWITRLWWFHEKNDFGLAYWVVGKQHNSPNRGLNLVINPTVESIHEKFTWTTNPRDANSFSSGRFFITLHQSILLIPHRNLESFWVMRWFPVLWASSESY